MVAAAVANGADGRGGVQSGRKSLRPERKAKEVRATNRKKKMMTHLDPLLPTTRVCYQLYEEDRGGDMVGEVFGCGAPRVRSERYAGREARFCFLEVAVP